MGQENMTQSLTSFLEAAGFLRIPLSRNGRGHFEASGTINGRPVRVLIDTGAAGTVVSLALATELGLEIQPLGPGGGSEVCGAELRVEGVVPRTRKLFAVDLSRINASLAKKGTKPIEVLLGVDVFDAQAAVIDYGSESLFLRGEEDTAHSLVDFLEAARFLRVPLGRTGVGHLEAAGTLNGHRVRVTIDSGAASTSVSLALATELALEVQPLAQAGGGAVGEIRGAELRVEGVVPRTRKLVAFDFAHINASLAMKGEKPVEVVLGVDVFDAQRAVIDYGSASLFLQDG